MVRCFLYWLRLPLPIPRKKNPLRWWCTQSGQMMQFTRFRSLSSTFWRLIYGKSNPPSPPQKKYWQKCNRDRGRFTGKDGGERGRKLLYIYFFWVSGEEASWFLLVVTFLSFSSRDCGEEKYPILIVTSLWQFLLFSSSIDLFIFIFLFFFCFFSSIVVVGK